MSKVALDSIASLLFYKEAYTNSRRTAPIPQLTCIGKPCGLFQPDVVRCVNAGGKGLDVEWKCEADLPDLLRLGRVEVSCEGWSRPGDSNVLKDSCALEYRLVRVPSALNNNNNNDDAHRDSLPDRILPKDPYETVFMIVWGAILLFLLYVCLKACFSSRPNSDGQRQQANNARPGGGGGGGWFSGTNNNNNNNNNTPPPPPPYYSDHKQPPPTYFGGNPNPNPGIWGWRPGFWPGFGLGSYLGSWWGGRQANNNHPAYGYAPPPVPPRRSFWDWERPVGGGGGGWGSWLGGAGREPMRAYDAYAPTASQGWYASPRRSSGVRAGGGGSGGSGVERNENRAEGSSNLGRTRTSTGYGGSKVR